MNNQSIPFRWLDIPLSKLLRVQSPALENQYAQIRKTVEHREHILYDMDIIDTKSSALLTHVSIMLAVIALLLESAMPGPWRGILVAELILFSSVGLLLLRCVDVMGPPFRMPAGDAHTLNTQYLAEMLFRRAVYQVLLRAVFVLTAFLIGSFAVKSML